MNLNYKILCTIYFWAFLTNVAEGADFTGDTDYEINRVDFSPFNDGILFNDIAEIINDFDSNMYSPTPSESDSDENIEDLLSEYQHYLEKAHKQKKIYEEKFKSKNKVPLLRRERFSKIKPFSTNKYVDYLNSFSNPFTFTEKSIDNQLDLFLPFNPDMKYIHRPAPYGTTSHKNNRDDKEKTITEEKQFINLPSPRTNYELMKSSCFCKDNQIPCDCDCKQCLMSLDTPYNDNFDQSKHVEYGDNKGIFPPMPFNTDNIYENAGYTNRIPEESENDLNIRIKVDIQVPRILENILKTKNRSQVKVTENDEKNSKETRFILHSPVSKINFPIPIEIFGLKKPIRLNKHDSTAMHKITIHKKKKSKLSNNGNKKHKKKIITFHNIKFEPQVLPQIDVNYNSSNINKVIEDRDSQPELLTFVNNTQKVNETKLMNHSIVDIAPSLNINTSTINVQLSDIPILIHNIENKTYDFHKTENSIEIDFVRKSNISTAMPKIVRNRRSTINKKDLKHDKNVTSNVTIVENKDGNTLKITKESSKILDVDSELLYWPNNNKTYNGTHTPKNITAIILERENNKVKLNLSQETIRNNHTMALEHAIFGNVDWNDVDTVAPVFLSFMGKYINGILTFCSQKICHSMKCFEKACIHRICLPENRFNHRGHCIGSNRTDSVATMETIMDLPSNIAFEIVDILQDKMLGKMFGKVTLCIGTKCITLVASKKNFFKSKCSIKELDSSGHCKNIKRSKVM